LDRVLTRGVIASTAAPFHQDMGVGFTGLAEAQPPVEIHGMIRMKCAEAHGYLANSGMFEHLSQDMRAYSFPLKLRVYHKLMNMNVAITVFNAHVAAGYIITQDDFMGCRRPAIGEELVLRFFIPRPELPHRHIPVRTMMHGAGKLRVGS
ncbi:MAG TPA: hypothetical protein VE360_12720, partial [Pyrinomonadaceae bacterium]|nr:hypothetical protein [Pyrinomonadaceae bacterium]